MQNCEAYEKNPAHKLINKNYFTSLKTLEDDNILW